MTPQSIPVKRAKGGKSSAELARTLMREIGAGDIPAGSFMLGERELSLKHSIARMTARRALKVLEADGYLRAERGHGYRILSRCNNPAEGCPVAFALYNQNPAEEWMGLNQVLLSSLQQASERRGWPVLGVGTAGQDAADIVKQCVSARAWGLIADTYDARLVSLAARAGLPVVMVDSWAPNLDVDVVFQNGFHGARQAVDHLVSLGHRRIAWYGQVAPGPHAAARLGGAYSALIRHGLDLPAELRVDAMQPEAPARLRQLLARPDRPTAILALWQPNASEAAAAVRGAGLELGRNVDLVGWVTAERYDRAMSEFRANGAVPAMVTWRVAEMAEMAIGRLCSRRERPAEAPVIVNIRTSLRVPAAAEK
jgi:DNA-binding LacI/PurR family transcriptional regulator